MTFSFIDVLKLSIIGTFIIKLLKNIQISISFKSKLTHIGENIGNCPYKGSINVHIRIIAFAMIYLFIQDYNTGKIDCSPPSNLGESSKIQNLDCLNNGLLFSDIENSKQHKKEVNYHNKTCRLFEDKRHRDFR